MTRLACSFIAYILLAGVLFCRNRGAYYPSQVFCVVAAFGLALLGSCVAAPGANGRGHPGRVVTGLALFIMAELAFLLLAPETLVGPSAPLARAPRYGLLAIGALVLSYAWRRMPAGRWRFLAIAGIWIGITAPMLAHWSPPPGDVWELQTEAIAHLLHGEDPYAAEYRNPFPDQDYYGEGMLKDNKIQSFPYTPLNLLLLVPGYVAGDIRWALLAAIVLAAVSMVAVGQCLGLPSGHPAELAAVAVLCHPQVWFVLESGWNEPLFALTLTAGLWAMAARRQHLAGLAVAATMVVKQYGILWLPAAWTSGRFTGRNLAPWLVVGLLSFVPFLLWHPRALYRGLVEFHLTSPFRTDSLSVSALVAIYAGNGHHDSGFHIPAAAGFIAAALVILLLLRRRVPELSQAVLGASAIFLAFFLFNKASHLNYYWLVESLLALATLLALGETSASSPPDEEAEMAGEQETRERLSQ